MSTTIERALAAATTLKREEGDTVELNAELLRLDTARSRLLPFEATARAELTERIENVQTTLKMIRVAESLDNLPRLDPVVFSWTKPQKSPRRTWYGAASMDVPALAYIPIDKTELRLTIENDGDVWINERGHRGPNGVPNPVAEQYATVMRGLRGHYNGWKMTLSYSYPGVVPEGIREIIATEYEPIPYDTSRKRLRRFDDLAFVCEVDSWKVDIEQRPRFNLDPILVGVKNDDCWVLGSFDPTTLESYIASEFTT